MIAVDQELIRLDDNIRELVPELRDVKLLTGFEDSNDKPRKPILKDVTDPISLRYFYASKITRSFSDIEQSTLEPHQWLHI